MPEMQKPPIKLPWTKPMRKAAQRAILGYCYKRNMHNKVPAWAADSTGKIDPTPELSLTELLMLANGLADGPAGAGEKALAKAIYDAGHVAFIPRDAQERLLGFHP
jgi:hypothetical protein